MNNSTKTLFCRVVFVLFVLLPTFGTFSYVACGIWRPVEMTPAAWSSLLSEKTGLEIRIAKMRRDGTGVFVLEGFEVGDPESDQVWISAPRVAVTVDGEGLNLESSEMWILASSVRPLSEHFQYRVLKSRKGGFQAFTLRASDCKLLVGDSDGRGLPMSKLEVATRMEEFGPTVELHAELMEEKVPVSIMLSAHRNREASAASTNYKWTVSGESGISARVLAEISPEWRSLGSFARFQGQIDVTDSRYTLSGIELWDVDLTDFGEHWGIRGISGIAFVTGQRSDDALPGARIEFQDGKFTDLFGEISIQNGKFDGPLLSRLARTLPLDLEAGIDFARRPKFAFTNCAVMLELRGENLKITGALDRGGVMETQEQVVARLKTPLLRTARDLSAAILNEMDSDILPVSQWVAAMPVPRGAAAATAGARKNSKSR